MKFIELTSEAQNHAEALMFRIYGMNSIKRLDEPEYDEEGNILHLNN